MYINLCPNRRFSDYNLGKKLCTFFPSPCDDIMTLASLFTLIKMERVIDCVLNCSCELSKGANYFRNIMESFAETVPICKCIDLKSSTLK